MGINGYDEYVDKVKNNIGKLFRDNKQTDDVKKHFDKYGVSGGYLQGLINDPFLLDEEDARLVALIGEQLFLRNGIDELRLEDNFNENKISDIRQYYFVEEDDSINFPYVFENVTEVSGGWYSFPISYSLLARLYNSQKLYYNFDVQRGAKYIRRKDQVIKTPYVNPHSVAEMTEYIIKEKLVPTNIVLNAALGSNGEDNIQIDYDKKKRTLTILEDVRVDIIDGMHRTIASVAAYEKAKSKRLDINVNFNVTLFNFGTKEAMEYQAQLAKANRITESRKKELEGDRKADEVIKVLRVDSDLKNAITSRDSFKRSESELVSYGVLSDAIEKEFEMKYIMDAKKVGEYLSEYFMYLFGSFGKYIYNNNYILFYNKMFAGHVRLASKMRKNNIPLENLQNLDADKFFKSSEELEKFGVTKSGELDSRRPEKPIEKFIDECIYPQIAQNVEV